VSGAHPLGRPLAAVAVVVAAWTALGVGARADDVSRTTADEPQYLLSAISLAEDRDLDIADELAAERYRPFHEVALPEQTAPLEGGRRVSPHDPLLPVLLAVPVALAGWVGAKLALAGLAGALAAATVWVAVRRFGVGTGVAAGTVVAFALAAPLSTYGVQVYPELPAALAVTVAVGALTGPLRGAGPWVAGAAIVALPWLGVKYVPVAAGLAAVWLWSLWRQGRRRTLVGVVGTLAVAGVGYVVAHRLLYGGWTAYAAGDHFVAGEHTVMGHQPNYPGRSVRLVGLLVDREFGLAAWAPGYLLTVPALAALLHRRPRGWACLVVPLALGWLTATFVALTMHGWWFPGRQVVVVLPLAVLAVAWWAERVRAVRPWVVGLGAVGVGTWVWLLVEVLGGRLTLVIDFAATANPLYRAWSRLLPGRAADPTDVVLVAVWAVALVALGVLGWRSVDAGAGDPRSASTDPRPAPPAADHPPNRRRPAALSAHRPVPT
jgi:hypothetical protein